MKNDIRLAALITVIIGCVFSISASGFNLSFLEDSPVAYFSDEDVDLMLDTFDRAMESNKDGEMSQWSNPKSGNGGTITVLETTTRDNQSCRKARIENQTKNSKGRSEFLFCQATDGSWKITQ
jgi:surface antigen